MLVLSRKKNECVVIGADGGIVVMVLEVRDGKAKLGISAPRAIPVWRQEIWMEIQDAEDRVPKAEPPPRRDVVASRPELEVGELYTEFGEPVG